MKRHLQYNWMKYLAVLLLPLLLWPTAFRLRERRHSEQVSILFVGEGLDTVQLQDALAEQAHKSVCVTQAVPGALPYHEFLTAQCFCLAPVATAICKQPTANRLPRNFTSAWISPGRPLWLRRTAAQNAASTLDF